MFIYCRKYIYHSKNFRSFVHQKTMYYNDKHIYGFLIIAYVILFILCSEFLSIYLSTPNSFSLSIPHMLFICDSFHSVLCLCVLVLRARFVRCVAVCVCFLLLNIPVCTYQFRSHGQDPTPTPKQTKCLLSSVFLRLKCWDLLLVLLKIL